MFVFQIDFPPFILSPLFLFICYCTGYNLVFYGLSLSRTLIISEKTIMSDYNGLKKKYNKEIRDCAMKMNRRT